MTETRKCQVLVIGAGPGGYVAGIRSAQLGLDTIVVEGDKAGGTCLIRGCIPSKAIIHAAERFEALLQHSSDGGHMGLSVKGEAEVDMKGLVAWKDSIVDRLNKGVEGLLRAAGADLIKGWANFDGPKSCTVDTGGDGVKIEAENVIIATGSSHIDLPFMPCDEEFILSSTGALELDSLPKSVAIVGGGYIGLELGCALAKLGSEITVVEGMGSILAIMDKEIRRPLELWLKKHKVSVHTDSLARGVEIKGRGASKKAELTFEKDGAEQKVAIPAIVFTEPEIVSVGLTPDEAKERGEEIIVGKFPLAANGRALSLEAEKTGGFIRVTARESDHVILGVQAVGSHVAELHSEFVLALEMGALLEDIAGTVHAHPTMSEAFHESVLKTLGHAIHIN